MSLKIFSTTIIGLNAEPIEVEASTSFGLANFFIVGLPDVEVKEARERVRAAMKKSNLPFPRGRLIVNLAPARVKKHGTHFDLPIALSLLACLGELNTDKTEQSVFLGELGLDGSVRPVTGVLVAAMGAKSCGFARIFVPVGNAAEASLVQDLDVYPVKTLSELLNHLSGATPIQTASKIDLETLTQLEYSNDLADVRGQEFIKRALEIAAAGSHNILMSGPPGSGKTLLAKTLPSILPAMTKDEILEVSKLFSIAGLLDQENSLIKSRSFRHPHHSASGVAVVGGGGWPKPGEISLAHRGILFLDEFPEFPRHVLETLRQPLEEGSVTISRAAGSVTFPAKFMLVAAMNPCPCGFSTDPEKHCNCTPTQIIRYRKKISGPLLDRIDIWLEVPRVKTDDLLETSASEPSAKVQQRVQTARDRQLNRFEDSTILTNSEMTTAQIKQFCRLSQSGTELIRRAVNQQHLSARAYTRVLKIARTVADLDGSTDITVQHLGEALSFRPNWDTI